MVERKRFYLISAILMVILISLFYWGIQQNYFYMDDFHWLARAIMSQDSIQEIFVIEGRDFNPVFLVLLSVLIKVFGVSVPVLRVVTLLIFAGLAFTFFHLLQRYFDIHRMVALLAALMFALNVFVSETVLNLSAMVYALALLLALWAIIFFLEKKKILFLLFMVAAFFTKETILLVMLPLFIYEKDKKNRIFLTLTGAGLVLLRVLLQLTAAASSYTSFLDTKNSFYKFYFLLLRSLNLSPYAIPLALGIGLLLVLFLGAGYWAWNKNQRGLWFFLVMFLAYALFFAVLPKLSSRYVLFPSLGFWGAAALALNYFKEKKERKILALTLIPILVITFLFNFVLIRKEVEDYRLLGDYSAAFIQKQGKSIKAAVSDETNGNTEITLYKGDGRGLAAVYKLVRQRANMPKLLPYRAHSIEGVIEPRHLIPIIYYPFKIARWNLNEETNAYFKGRISFD